MACRAGQVRHRDRAGTWRDGIADALDEFIVAIGIPLLVGERNEFNFNPIALFPRKPGNSVPRMLLIRQ